MFAKRYIRYIKEKIMKKILASIMLVATFSSCVTSKIHKELQDKYDTVLSEKQGLEEENINLEAELEDAKNKLASVEEKIKVLKQQSDADKAKLAALQKDYDALSESYNLLTSSSNSRIAKNASKNLELLKNLEKSRALLEEENAKLKDKEKKIAELEYLMKERENKLAQMKKSISDALLGFKDKGLTVEQRNGKVYVSLENRLLFPSGSWNVNPQGKQAIGDLAEVLKKQNDISILIEGHTDADRFNGKGAIEDNWDLSVKRATSIVKLLMKTEGIDPTKITAAGRSKYIPVATNKTKAGKSKNRRIEVIIEPDLSKIKDMLDSF
jgi:chemotaxis protein MotB